MRYETSVYNIIQLNVYLTKSNEQLLMLSSVISAAVYSQHLDYFIYFCNNMKPTSYTKRHK